MKTATKTQVVLGICAFYKKYTNIIIVVPYDGILLDDFCFCCNHQGNKQKNFLRFLINQGQKLMVMYVCSNPTLSITLSRTCERK